MRRLLGWEQTKLARTTSISCIEKFNTQSSELVSRPCMGRKYMLYMFMMGIGLGAGYERSRVSGFTVVCTQSLDLVYVSRCVAYGT